MMIITATTPVFSNSGASKATAAAPPTPETALPQDSCDIAKIATPVQLAASAPVPQQAAAPEAAPQASPEPAKTLLMEEAPAPEQVAGPNLAAFVDDAGETPEDPNHVRERLTKIVTDQLPVKEEQVTLEASFIDDLGADSLDAVEIQMGIETEFDIKIGEDDFSKLGTVGDTIDYIQAKLAEK